MGFFISQLSQVDEDHIIKPHISGITLFGSQELLSQPQKNGSEKKSL